jgi:hypothetical protein
MEASIASTAALLSISPSSNGASAKTAKQMAYVDNPRAPSKKQLQGGLSAPQDQGRKCIFAPCLFAPIREGVKRTFAPN